MIISGDIDEIRFRNEENGYTIIVIDCEGEPVVAVGNFPPLTEGESVRLCGNFIIHPKFGKQFKTEKISKTAPDTLHAITRYLGSGLIRGVGEKTALAIVEMFGKDSLQVIEYNPSALSKVRGISKNKADEISKCFRENKDMQEALMFLQNRNISLNLSLKIYKHYGQNTITVITSNPYRLTEDIDGIGFATADKIAAEMGISKDSGFRIRAMILYTLKESSDKYGNTYLPTDELCDELIKLGISDKAKILQHIDELAIDRNLIYCTFGGEEAVMLKKSYSAERNIALKLIKLSEIADKTYYDCSVDIDEFERIGKLQLHDNQRYAIDCAINNGVSIITGGPGTGKTTILKCLLKLCEKLKLRPILMAPTGRAAKRLFDSTGFEAATIHRALMMSPDNDRNETLSKQKINADIVIVDEFSMVDIYLFNNLLNRMSIGTKFVIVGDKDQLPSVGAGNCLKDLLDSDLFSSVNLTKIYRQSNNSLITLNAHAINQGEMPELLVNSSNDFFFLKCKEQPVMAAKIIELYSERIPKYLNVDTNKIQILCPMKSGLVGTKSLNRSLQGLLTVSSDAANLPALKPSQNGDLEQKGDRETFKVGDKVMHISNNYSLEWIRQINYSIERGEGIFNGDIGKIMKINPDNGSIDVEMEDGRQVTYTPDILDQLSLAYAITVHKSQGSEFDAVIMPVTLGSPTIMTRNLLYTAITRAKRMVVLVGEEYSIRRMVDNNYIAKRYSALNHFLFEIKSDMRLLFDESHEEVF